MTQTLAGGGPGPEAGYPPHEHPAGAYPVPQYVAPPVGRFARAVSGFVNWLPGWAGPVGVAACFAGGAALVLATDPTDSNASSMPTCVIKLTTGFDCPGCGGTRAFYYLMHANLPAAARHHALAVFAAPFIVWIYIAWFAQAAFGRTLPAPRITSKVVGVFLAVWMVFTVVRNLPWAPFTWLYV